MYITKEIGEYKELLQQEQKRGLVLDIDETLSGSVWYFMEELQKKFGNSENLTVSELIEKYRYTHDVPDWKTEEAHTWMEEASGSNELQKHLPIIPNANKIVQQINSIIPIVGYVTARPSTVMEGTKQWLKSHDFPEAPLILRPEGLALVNGSEWKAAVLEYLYPEACGIVDDNPALTAYVSGEYKGAIYLYNATVSSRSDIKVIPCSTWDDVLDNVRKYHE